MAVALGIGRTTVWRKLRELSISVDDFRVKRGLPQETVQNETLPP
jgi:hypothetical protein